MIFDFGCRDPLVWSHIEPALTGSFMVVAVVMGLAFIGRSLTRGFALQSTDIFSGWGVVALVMTVSAMLADHVLSYTAYGVFALMVIACGLALKDRCREPPFWPLLIFPGVLILTMINLSGVGSWDDFAHWALNEIFLFENDGIPNATDIPHFSMHPLYPYGLPFLSYLASKLAGGFLIQGGSMMNFVFLLAFAAMIVETHQAESGKEIKPFGMMTLTLLVLLFVSFANPAFYAPDMINNTGDLSAAILYAALGLLLWRLIALLKSTDRTAMKSATMQAALIALAFMLVKEVDVFLLGLLGFGFLVLAAKNKIFKPALLRLLMITVPALAVRCVWQWYVDVQLADPHYAEIRGYVFAPQPFVQWHFDELNLILTGMRDQITTHAAEFIMLALVAGYGAVGLFRPSTRRRDLALLASIGCCGYAVFLLLAYLGSSFNVYEIQSAASFARYMAHVSLLAMAALGLALAHGYETPKWKTAPALHAVPWLGLFVLLAFYKQGLVPQPSQFVCTTRNWGHAVATQLPDGSQLAVLNPEGDYLFSRIINFELAEEELRTGHYLNMPWHITLFTPTEDEVQRQFGLHPETNALLYTPAGYELLKPLGFIDNGPTLFQLREGTVWKAALPHYTTD